VGDRPDRACGRAGPAPHAEALVDDMVHQVAPAGLRPALGELHQRGEVLLREFLLVLVALQEQVCHHAHVPDELRAGSAPGDVDIHLDEVPDWQVGLVLGLVSLATTCKTRDVAVTGTPADCHDDGCLLAGLLDLLY